MKRSSVLHLTERKGQFMKGVYIVMKRRYMIIFQAAVVFIYILTPLLSGTADTMAQGKKRWLTERNAFCCKVNNNEYMEYDDYEQQWNIYRTVPGLVAKNVTNVWTCNDDDKVFLSCKKNEIREIDFSHWTGKGNIAYKSSFVDGEAKEVFSMGSRKLLIRNERGELYYTGYGKCDVFWKHNTKEDCNSDKKLWKKVKVLDGVRKCWSSQSIFAYVKDNALHIVGYNVEAEGKLAECWERNEQEKICFQGAGEKVEEVIVSESEVFTDSCIFVRMKDGSVWAMGKNKHKMFGDQKKEYVNDFEKIISKDVIRMGVCEDRVAVLKKDQSLWMWGRDMKKSNGKCLAKPYKVADAVKEFTINGSGNYCHMLILKTNGTAYGLGGKRYVKVFTGKKAKWYTKPVKIMDQVKHIYSGGTIYTGGGANTFLLTKKKELYWMGKISCYRPFYQWAEGTKWKLKLKRVPMDWTSAFQKRIGAY